VVLFVAWKKTSARLDYLDVRTVFNENMLAGSDVAENTSMRIQTRIYICVLRYEGN
jgi:hypothetical protein